MRSFSIKMSINVYNIIQKSRNEIIRSIVVESPKNHYFPSFSIAAGSYAFDRVDEVHFRSLALWITLISGGLLLFSII